MLLSFLLALLLPCFFVCCIRFDRFRIGVLYALTSLCFCFPVYAEDEAYTFDSEITEFTYLQNNELQLNQIENNIIQDEIQTQEEITAILSEPLADPSPILRSVSGDSNSASFSLTRVDNNRYYFSSSYLGDIPTSDFDRFAINCYDLEDNFLEYIFTSDSYLDPITGYISLPDNSLRILASFRFKQDGIPVYGNSRNVYSADLTSEAIDPGYVSRGDFFTVITTFLTWILSSFSVLTTWILADSMAAVYAAIFLVGCAIAMLFRVLRSA